LITQSDPGGENTGIAKAHTYLRQLLDPDLRGTVQHRVMRTKMNIKAEIKWSVFRRQFVPGFEKLLNHGLENNIYIPRDHLHRCVTPSYFLYALLITISLVFHWLAIPWMQSELDLYRTRSNGHMPRYNRRKLLPHGIPNEIFEHPEQYGSHDFKVLVTHFTVHTNPTHM
jgi:hypothetical protein